jgi:small-conductance mechanosensitive channel
MKLTIPTLFRKLRDIVSAWTGPLFSFIYAFPSVGLVLFLVGMEDHLDLADKILALVVSSLSLCFIALYGTRSNWRATREGRALMYLTVAFTASVLIAAVARLFAFAGADLIRYIVFSVFIMAEVHIIYVLYRAQTTQRNAVVKLERAMRGADAPPATPDSLDTPPDTVLTPAPKTEEPPT